MTKIYFIAGASGSGKTAIKTDLQKILGNSFNVYDFDDIGVAENADKKWRGQATEKWLQKLLQENKNACLLGQMVLGEILACPSAKHLDKVNFCLLDVSSLERINRLQQSKHHAKPNQNMLNWSSWLKIHTKNPSWEQHVIKDDCWNELDFSNWDSQKNWNLLANVKLLDTTTFNISQVAELVADWVNNPNAKNTIIFLNGTSSSGKTSITKKLQEKLASPYMHVGIDKMVSMIPEKMNDIYGDLKEREGFYWHKSTDKQGNTLYEIQLGSYAKKISGTYKKLVAFLANENHNIIVDEVCLDKEGFQNWQNILADFNTIYVKVQGSLETIIKREKDRGDRMIGSSRAQYPIVHKYASYDLEINTDNLSPDEAAEKIINFMNDK
ncbi:MAG: AAA family ATPase [Rickettsiaceae bacterium]|nr:AAA family ATPase [Rickettsiaceae bacterium]